MMLKTNLRKLKLPRKLPALFLMAALPAAAFMGCAGRETKIAEIKKPSMMRLAPKDYPQFSDDMGYDALAQGLLQSLSYLKRVNAERMFDFGHDRYDAAHMIRSLSHFMGFIQSRPSPKELNVFIRENYRVYKSVGNSESGRVLFTGYYEPLLQGRTQKTAEYQYPVYARPADHMEVDLALFSEDFKGRRIIGRNTGMRLVPYYDRRQIEVEKRLEGKAPVLAWVKDRVGLFFLQIQGSGKIYLENGRSINVHYHTTNGQPYRSIGKLLIDEGKIPREEMSMQRIRAYLRDHPREIDTVLNYNPSYVFFKIEKEGPLGYLEVLLTPGRSMALDWRIFPAAALGFIQTQTPVIDGAGRIDRFADTARFALNQDTGGAIRGPGRADLFWGNGPYAQIAAGHMQNHGDLYLLVLSP